MKTLKYAELKGNEGLQDEICRVLDEGGLVCLPCNGTYRILADLHNVDAVTRLYQSKRKVKKSAALVFVHGDDMLDEVAADVTDAQRRLAASFWPGPLTIMFDPSKDMPRKVSKQLINGSKKVGVRVPDSDLVKGLIRKLGRPVVVSSANRARKPGEGSAAQVRKNFGRGVDLFIDAGDIEKEWVSTVVDIDGESVSVVREGAISEQEILNEMAS